MPNHMLWTLVNEVVSSQSSGKPGNNVGYYIDRSNPIFPAIKPCLGGASLASLTVILIRHHLQAAVDHLKAMERLINNAIEPS